MTSFVVIHVDNLDGTIGDAFDFEAEVVWISGMLENGIVPDLLLGFGEEERIPRDVRGRCDFLLVTAAGSHAFWLNF